MFILLTLFTFFNCAGARLRHGEVEDARGGEHLLLRPPLRIQTLPEHRQ